MDAPSNANSFRQVPLPACDPGRVDPETLVAGLEACVTSEPLRALVTSSGWTWPKHRDLRTLVPDLVVLSDHWDFRHDRERNLMNRGPVFVGSLRIPEDLIESAAAALGLVDNVSPVGRFDSVVVLSGLV